MQMVWPSGENNDPLFAEAWRSGHEHPNDRFQRGDRVEYKKLIFTVWDVGGPDLANAMTAAEVTERLRLQKEIDTRNMDSVEADLTTWIDAAVSHVQQTAQLFQTTSEAEQSLESETEQHRGEQDRQRHCRQQSGNVRTR